MLEILSQTVGHVPRKISRPIYHFLKNGDEVCGKVADDKYRPSPISKCGLEITTTVTSKISATKQEILQRLDSIINESYDESPHEGIDSLEWFDAEKEEKKKVRVTLGIRIDDEEDAICLEIRLFKKYFHIYSDSCFSITIFRFVSSIRRSLNFSFNRFTLRMPHLYKNFRHEKFSVNPKFRTNEFLDNSVSGSLSRRKFLHLMKAGYEFCAVAKICPFVVI